MTDDSGHPKKSTLRDALSITSPANQIPVTRKKRRATSSDQPLAAPSAGDLVRLLRRRRNLTLDELALAVGLSKSHLSRYERGEKSLSVSSLIRLAKALGTSVAALLGEAPQGDLVHVVRAGDRIATEAAQATEGGYEFVALSRPGDVRSSAFIARLSDFAVMNSDAYHGGEELLYVMSGSVELELSTKSVLLRKGDFAQFPGAMHHRLRGMEKSTEVLIVVTNVDA